MPLLLIAQFEGSFYSQSQDRIGVTQRTLKNYTPSCQ